MIALVAVLAGRGGIWSAVTYAAIALLGGAVLGTFDAGEPLAFATAVAVVFMLAHIAGFASTAVYHHLRGVLGVPEAFRTVCRTMLPFELAAALLTAGVAFCYGRLGLAALVLFVVVMVVFHHLARTGVKAYERGEELARRTEELGTLQVGVLTTVMQTLTMRDPMTARHSGAVARYSRDGGRDAGARRARDDLIHTAALLHDIGKFILPDSILFANRKLTDEEWRADQAPPRAGRQARRADRRLRPGRRDRPAPPRAVLRWWLPGRHRGRRDPAWRADHRRRRHLRRHDRARLLPQARELRGRPGRAAPRRRDAARPAWSSRPSMRMILERGVAFSHTLTRPTSSPS